MTGKANHQMLLALGKQLLVALGEDPTRPALADTPKRWANMWREFIEYNPGNTDTVFEMRHTTDQMVVVSGMRVWSMCEHHLLPFWCDVSVGYIPADVVLGLSKFGRIAEQHAHMLQTQERLVEQICADVIRKAGTCDVAVIARGEHLCMTMRGVKKPAIMTSSAMHGAFYNKPEARQEFLSLVR